MSDAQLSEVHRAYVEVSRRHAAAGADVPAQSAATAAHAAQVAAQAAQVAADVETATAQVGQIADDAAAAAEARATTVAADQSARAAATSAQSAAQTSQAVEATVLAAVNAQGQVQIAATRAEANAATLADGDVVEVQSDETRSGHRTRYRHTGGALALLLDLDEQVEAQAAGVVRAEMSFRAVIDPDAASPDELNGGVFTKIKSAVDAAPVGAEVHLMLGRGRDHVIDESIDCRGRTITIVPASGSGANPTITQKTKISSGRNALPGFYGADIFLRLVNVVLTPEGRADQSVGWHSYDHSLVIAPGMQRVQVAAFAIEVIGDDGYAIVTCRNNTSTLMVRSVALSGAVFLARGGDKGIVMLTKREISLTGGAALIEGGVEGVNVFSVTA